MITAMVSELTGPALDWAVAKCEGHKAAQIKANGPVHLFMTVGYSPSPYSPSTNWAQGGPILEREWLDPTPWPNESREDMRWHCQQYDSGGDCDQYGPTLLIAGMRCYVASKFGDTIELPEELKS